MVTAVLDRRLILLAIGLAYAARPISCSYVLNRFSVNDDVPYARFDPHGFSMSFGVLGALVYAYPVMWVARRVVAGDEVACGTSQARASVVGSAIVMFLIALPAFVQIEYMVGLPLIVMWPVIASVGIWVVVVMLTWVAWLRSPQASCVPSRLKIGAVGLALLMTLPKIRILTLFS